MKLLTHREGVLIALSSGEYSDYSFDGLYRTRKDLHLPTLAQEYQDTLNAYQRGTATGFGSFLIRNGWADEVAYDEIHLDYYTFSETAGECKEFGE